MDVPNRGARTIDAVFIFVLYRIGDTQTLNYVSHTFDGSISEKSENRADQENI